MGKIRTTKNYGFKTEAKNLYSTKNAIRLTTEKRKIRVAYLVALLTLVEVWLRERQVLWRALLICLCQAPPQ